MVPIIPYVHCGIPEFSDTRVDPLLSSGIGYQRVYMLILGVRTVLGKEGHQQLKPSNVGFFIKVSHYL